MLKLRDIYLRRIFFYFLSFIVTVGVVLFFGIKNIYIQELKKELLHDITLAKLTLQKGDSLENLQKSLGVYFTLIDTKEQINNPQLQELTSKKVYYSVDSQKEFLVVAKKEYIENKELIIQASKAINSIKEAFLTLFMELLGVIALFTLAIFYSFYKIGLDIQSEIKKIVKFLKSLTKKEKELTIASEYSQEFWEIAKLLSKVSKVLDKRERQKLKYTKRLEKSNAQKEEILLAISQRLKNPITVINGYAQTLLEQELAPSYQKAFLENIAKNSTTLVDSIDTLRLAIRLDEAKQQLHIEEFDICELAKEVSKRVKKSFLDREIILKGKSKIVRADRALFEIVLKNLLENALQYSDDEVIIHCTNEYIEVIDRGVGIKEKDLEKITEKFYRVNKNRWSNLLGLGLFIVKNILTLHKMRLEIQSKPHQGSTFRIYFNS